MGHPPRLPWSQRLSYGVGHALNDLAASMWFSYLMVYLQLVLRFDANYAGLVLLVGQVADAIATPLLGFEVTDPAMRSHFCKKYGRRKFLHLIGTLCVIVSFPFIFSVCPGCLNSSEFALTIMIIPLVIIFQFGWAAVQVSHLSLIPVITPHETERDFLNVFRYSVNIISDISTYLIVWAVFDLTRTPLGTRNMITEEYSNKFMLIVILVVGTGTLFSIIFHIGLKENTSSPPSSEDNSIEKMKKRDQKIFTEFDPLLAKTVPWKGWLRESHFYQVGLLYMFCRLFANMSSVFMPLYLQESLKADDDFIAKIPLVMNLSGFVISIALPKFFKVFSKKVTLLAGAGLGVGSCAWLSIGEGASFLSSGIYGVGILMGAAASTLVVSSLSFTHDLIGTSAESGAFVYGCMSFCDKLANGIAGMVVQNMHSVSCKGCNWFYRDVMAYFVGGTAVLAGLVVLSMMHANLGQRKSIYNGAVLSPKQELISYKSIRDHDEATPLLEQNESKQEEQS